MLRLKKAWKGVRTTFRKILFTRSSVFQLLPMSCMLTSMVVLALRHKTNHPIFSLKNCIYLYWKSSVQVVKWNFSLKTPRVIGLVTHGAKYNVSETCCVLSLSLCGETTRHWSWGQISETLDFGPITTRLTAVNTYAVRDTHFCFIIYSGSKGKRKVVLVYAIAAYSALEV